jgi:hypothetical protein
LALRGFCGGPAGCHATQHKIGERTFWADYEKRHGQSVEQLIESLIKVSPRRAEIEAVRRETGADDDWSISLSRWPAQLASSGAGARHLTVGKSRMAIFYVQECRRCGKREDAVMTP